MLLQTFSMERNNYCSNFDEIYILNTNNSVFYAIGFTYPLFIKQELLRVVCVETTESKNKIKRRLLNMTKDKNIIQELDSEINDDYSDDSLFNITSWGADLSFREICSMYQEDELIKPELQRKYVWDKSEASRFIESILMGLPIPSVFFAQQGSQKLIVDGYQRIMTVNDYITGIFSTDGKVFKLSNSEKINERWRNKSFSELSTDDQRKIKSSTIHAIIFEQKKPENDDTSMYQVFERINTSGRTLTPQEIRNCVYQGAFNSLLIELNNNEIWRKLFGSSKPDTRMRDIECILRFFVMKSDAVRTSPYTQISLKKELNNFMGHYRSASESVLEEFKNDFITMVESANELFCENAFRNYNKGKFIKKFHPAIFDAISVAVYELQKQGNLISNITNEDHINLLTNTDFINAASIHTTDVSNIKKRINLVKNALRENGDED